jgi:hypothetical protein
VEIDGRHKFASVNTNSPRSYGIGLNASFSRIVNGVLKLASGNQVTKQGFYTYFDDEGETELTDQIGLGVGAGSPLSYTVPSAGSTSANTIPLPMLSARESNRRCADFAGSGGCDTAGERLRTVLSVTLTNQNDKATIPGGDHTIAGEEADGFVDAVLASLTAVARLHQKKSDARINPFDDGHLTVELLCNPSFPCKNVDRASLRFGPLKAIPKCVKLKDVNGDGDADLRIKVAQQHTGIESGHTDATLSGTIVFPSFGPVDFDAIVGFYTAPRRP